MQILPKISKIFRNISDIPHMNAHRSTRRAPDGSISALERELYGMDIHQQFVVRQVLSMAGHVVLVRRHTLATDKKSNPCYLQQGREVTIAKKPLTFDPQGDVHINVLDESNKHLSMRISDYIRDIYVSD